MPDIKRTFTKGKMNKDLDERLVPSGEYRHAMNVQVSTSDGSDVGVVQNLLGNSEINVGGVVIDDGSVCVGSVADEKTNAIYWLIAETNRRGIRKSMILEYKDDIVSPVLVFKSIITATYDSLGEGFVVPYLGQGIDPNPDSWMALSGTSATMGGFVFIAANDTLIGDVTFPDITGSRLGSLLACYNYDGVDIFDGLDIRVAYGTNGGPTVNGNLTGVALNKAIPNSLFPGGLTAPVVDYVTFRDERRKPGTTQDLEFLPNVSVTGINVIDGFLVWTDGISEPKKINIDRCKRGTVSNGETETLLVNYTNEYQATLQSSEAPMHVDNITVIKKKPSLPLSVTPNYTLDPNKNYAARFLTTIVGGSSQIVYPTSAFNFGLLNVGDTFVVNLNKDISGNTSFLLDYIVGDEVNIQSFHVDDTGTQVLPPLPISTPHITGIILAANPLSTYPNSFESQQVGGGVIIDCYINIRIKSIDRQLLLTPDPTLGANFVIERKTPISTLFNNKFVRFGYRYRYLDNEYSAISPFSPAAFYPGEYNYSSDKGYNLSMSNTIQSLQLSGFNSISTPADVDAIDILYKDDFSPSIYIAETINPPINTLTTPSFDINSADIFITSNNAPNPATNKYLEFNSSDTYRYYHYNIPDFHRNDEFTISFRISNYNGEAALRFWANDSDSATTVSYYFKGNGVHTQTFKLSPLHPGAVGSGSFPSSIVFQGSGFQPGAGAPYFDGEVSDIVLVRGATSWFSDSTLIKSSGVGALLPTNQLLRAFDSVPLTAKSQEIVGNRIVYGNYTEGFDGRTKQGIPYHPGLEVNVSDGGDLSINHNIVGKSIKSLRDYQVGVSLVDRFGRESTVLSETKSTTRVAIEESIKHNRLHVDVTADKNPNDGDFFKFYVKETEGEYYNLALERYYKGDVDTMWLAFSSSDRNKIDKDDYLILKKGVNDIGAVLKENKYKILDISNEAPRIVRTTISTVANEMNLSDILFEGNTTNIPEKGKDKFQMNYEYLNSTPAGNLHKTRVIDGTFHVQFERGGELSNEYEVAKIHCSWDGLDTASMVGSHYEISTIKPFGSDVDFIANAPGETVATNTSVIIRQHEERGRPEFDGKFFVKITPDEIFHGNTNPSVYNPTEIPLVVVASRKIYSIDQNHVIGNGFGIDDELDPTIFNLVAQRRKHHYMSYFTDFGVEDSNADDEFNYTEQSGYKMYPSSDGNVGPAPTQGFWHMPHINGNAENTGSLPTNSYSYDSIGNTSSGNKKASLVFGGLFSKDWQWNTVNDKYFDIPGFFDVINGGNPNHTEGRFAKQIYPGSRYRWKDDPSGEVHTINPGVIPYQKAHFSEDGQDQPHSNHFVGNSFHTHPANWSKGFGFGDDRSAGSWDPLKNYGDFINLGLEIELTLNANGWSTITLDEMKLGVSSITGNASNNNGVATAELKVGMAIKKYDGADWMTHSSAHTQTLVVKRIEQLSNGGYYLYVGGFKTPIKPGDHVLGLQNGVIITFGQPMMNGYSPLTVSNHQTSVGLTGQTQVVSVGYELEFLDEDSVDDGADVFSQAVLETEPKSTPEVNLYYEVGQNIPFELSLDSEAHGILSRGQKGYITPPTAGRTGYEILNFRPPNKIYIKGDNDTAGGNELYNSAVAGSEISFAIADGTVVTTTITSQGANYLEVNKNLSEASFLLPWHNCWSFGNGVESNRIKDTFNLPFLSNGVKANAVGDEILKKKIKKSGLIFSGMYNSNTNRNSLNEFIKAEGITKDLNPVYGSIQKLHTRDSDLIAFCEDKVLRILANKDALFNADGNTNITASSSVLGQAVPYAGEYGISKNPESFASEAFRVYFTDKQRGKVLRLSKDGLTPISDYGMNDWFNEHLKLGDTIKGSYDPKKKEYNVTVKKNPTLGQHDGFLRTVSYNESTDGWVSFKSFYPESATSIAGSYFTFQHGKLWQHHVEEIDQATLLDVNRNSFYGGHWPTSFKAIVNESPEVVKSFATMSYEGSQSKVNEIIDYNTIIGANDPSGVVTVTGTYLESNYYNLSAKKGWFVNNIKTDIESGSIGEFINKEGKWFNHIRGESIITSPETNIITQGFDTSSFDIQGIGEITIDPQLGPVYGCTDDSTFVFSGWEGDVVFNTSINYYPGASVDDGTCVDTVVGCMDVAASNYDGGANADYGCQYPGCTDSTMFNYDPTANWDNGTCIPVILGCTDPSQFTGDYYASGVDPNPDGGTGGFYGTTPHTFNSFYNYNSNANTEDGSCIATILGCTNSNASNFIPLVSDTAVDVNLSDNSCSLPLYACVELSQGYQPCNSWWLESNGNGGYNWQTAFTGQWAQYNQVIDDGSCEYCSDPLASNYDGADPTECSAATISAQNNSGQNIGTDACLYFSCSATSCNMPFSDPSSPESTLGPQAASDCNQADQIPISFWEMELQPVVYGSGGTPWDINAPATQTATYNYPNLPSVDGDFYWTGLNGCSWYAMRARAAVIDPVSNAVTYSAWGGAGDGATACSGPGCTDNTGAGNNVDTDGNGTLGTWAACNYEAWASSDDGSCEYTSCSGCTDSNYLEYCNTCYGGGPWAGSDPSDCLTLGVYGCTDTTAYNYDATVTVDDGSCAPNEYGCKNHYTKSGNMGYGCAGSCPRLATNYDPNANTPCNDDVGTWDWNNGYYVPQPNATLLPGEEGYIGYDSSSNAGIPGGNCCEYGDCPALLAGATFTIGNSGVGVGIDAASEIAGARWNATITLPDGSTHVEILGNNGTNFTGGYYSNHGQMVSWSTLGGAQTGVYSCSIDVLPEPVTWGSVGGGGSSTLKFYTCGVLQLNNITHDPYGCTDPTASNYCSTCSINEVSSTDSSDPCQFTGCMDTTPTWWGKGLSSSTYYLDQGWGYQGYGYAATNYDIYATTACNTVSDNDCCVSVAPTCSLWFNHNNGTMRARVDVNNMIHVGPSVTFTITNMTVKYYDDMGSELPNIGFTQGASFTKSVNSGNLFLPYAFFASDFADAGSSGTNYDSSIQPPRKPDFVSAHTATLTMDIKNNSDPSGTVHSISKTYGAVDGPNGSNSTGLRIGCTDPYGGVHTSDQQGRDPYARIETLNFNGNGYNSVVGTACEYAPGCSNVLALNYDPTIVDSDGVPNGSPADCFYGEAVDISNISIIQDDSTPGETKLVFSDNFDPTTLTDPASGINHQKIQATTGTPAFNLTMQYKLPSETDWKANNKIYNPFQNASLPSGYSDALGVWQDGSTGNAWSGKPWINPSWLGPSSGYLKNADGTLISGVSFRIQVYAIVSYDTNTNMQPEGWDAQGNPQYPAAGYYSEWGHAGGDNKFLQPHSENHYFQGSGRRALQSAFGREIQHSGMGASNYINYNKPYIEYTVI